MKKIKFSKLTIIFVAGIAIIGAIWIHAAYAAKEDYMQEAVKIRNLNVFSSYEGNIEAAEIQEVYATSTSTMKKLYVSEGDTVKKGDLLYELEGDQIRSKLTQAQASAAASEIAFQDAETNLQRITALYQEGAVSLSQYESAKSSQETAEAQLTKAQADLDIAGRDASDLKKYAEIDGEVADINVSENQTMLSSLAIMDVINYDRLIVKIKIDEFDLDTVTEGDPAEVVVTALNKTASGTVSRISKKAEVSNGVSFFEAEVALASDAALKVGLSAEIHIAGQHTENAVSISMNALQFDAEDHPCVLIQGSGRAPVLQPITVGINDGIYVEIKSGLKSGDIVLIPPNADSQSALKLPVPGRRIAASAAQ